MTRREFVSVASAGIFLRGGSEPVLTVPLRVVLDVDAKLAAWRLRRFWTDVWEEAVREFAHCGVRFDITWATGEVERPEECEPIISGLDPGMLNLVITGGIPMEWDRGLALGGVTTRYRGRYLCMVAIHHAHGNQVPFLSLNTCVHELLHALLLDIFEQRPAGVRGLLRETRIDCHATLMWLRHDSTAVREGTRQFLRRG